MSMAFDHYVIRSTEDSGLAVTALQGGGRYEVRVEKGSPYGFSQLLFAETLTVREKTLYSIAIDIQTIKKSFNTDVFLFTQEKGAGIERSLGTQIESEEYSFAEGYCRCEFDTFPVYGPQGYTQTFYFEAPEDAEIEIGIGFDGGQCELLFSKPVITCGALPSGWPGGYSSSGEPPYNEQRAREVLAQREDAAAKIARAGEQVSITLSNGVRTGIINNNMEGEHRYAGFAAAGFQIHRVVPRFPFPFTQWKDEYMRAIEQSVLKMLSGNPGGYAMMNIDCNSPDEWNLAHPDDVWTAEDGDKWYVSGFDSHPRGKAPFGTKGIRYTASYGSPAYQELTRQCAATLAMELSKSEVSKVIVGFALCGGNDGQFYCNSMNWGLEMDWQLDHSEGHQQGFRAFLREKYGTLEALRDAWQDSGPDFDTATVAPEKYRNIAVPFAAKRGLERQLADSFEFRSYAPTKLLLGIAQALRQNYRKQVFINCWMPDASNGHCTNKYMLQALLDAPDGFDANAEVQAYRFWRQVGGCGYSIGTWGSYLIRDKLLITECDYRTYRSPTRTDTFTGYSDQWLGVKKEVSTFRAQLLRDAAASASRGMGLWIYDMQGGWYDSPELWDIVREAGAMVEHCHHCGAPREIDAAIFFDEKAGRMVTYDNWDLIGTPAKQKYALDYSGVNYDAHLLGDLAHPALPDYRLLIFPALHTITARQAELIYKLAHEDGKTVLLVGLPGMAYHSGAEIPGLVEQICGVKCRLRAAGESAACITVCGTPLGLEAGVPFISGGRLRYPALEIIDDSAEVIGRWKDGAVSHAIKRLGRGAVALAPLGSFIFGLLPEYIAGLAKLAGVRHLGACGNPCFVGSGIAALHKTSPLSSTVRFGRPVNIIHPGTGEVLCENTREWTFDNPYLTTDYVFYS